MWIEYHGLADLRYVIWDLARQVNHIEGHQSKYLLQRPSTTTALPMHGHANLLCPRRILFHPVIDPWVACWHHRLQYTGLMLAGGESSPLQALRHIAVWLSPNPLDRPPLRLTTHAIPRTRIGECCHDNLDLTIDHWGTEEDLEYSKCRHWWDVCRFQLSAYRSCSFTTSPSCAGLCLFLDSATRNVLSQCRSDENWTKTEQNHRA